MATIGIFDSGVGGLSVFREIRKILPCEKYLYYADNAWCPYGEKEPQFIFERAREITLQLASQGADIIVVACNTATAAAIASLRSEFSLPSDSLRSATFGRIDRIRFIGMEPAVKPAALGTRSGVIGVLATAGTLAGSKYLTTKGLYEDNIRIEEHVGSGFVELVENRELSGPHAEEVVRASLQPLLDAGADTIVLGCTHYPFLIDTIRKVADSITAPQGREPVRIIDPAPAVARQLLKVLDEEHIPHKEVPSAGTAEGTGVVLMSSGPSESLRALFSIL